MAKQVNKILFKNKQNIVAPHENRDKNWLKTARKQQILILTFACVYYSTASDNGTTAQPFVYTLSIPVSNAVIRN